MWVATLSVNEGSDMLSSPDEAVCQRGSQLVILGCDA